MITQITTRTKQKHSGITSVALSSRPFHIIDQCFRLVFHVSVGLLTAATRALLAPVVSEFPVSDDVLWDILGYLEAKDAHRISRTSRALHSLLRRDVAVCCDGSAKDFQKISPLGSGLSLQHVTLDRHWRVMPANLRARYFAAMTCRLKSLTVTRDYFCPMGDSGNSEELVQNKKEAFDQFLEILSLLVRCQQTVEFVRVEGPVVELSCVLEEDAAIPHVPAELFQLKEVIFKRLKEVHFGYTVDSRHVVPFIDFCNFPKLLSVSLGRIQLAYHGLGAPQFGALPTVVLAPQMILTGGEEDDLQWGERQNPHLPALYNGNLDKQLRFQGRGVYASPYYHYEGEFSDGMNHGYGRMTSSNGEVYEGEWMRGRRHGHGVVTHADGRVMDGNWRYDVFEGFGTLKAATGLVYEGMWREHMWNGWGVLSVRGRLVAYGLFCDGNFHGWVRVLSADAKRWDTAIYEHGARARLLRSFPRSLLNTNDNFIELEALHLIEAEPDLPTWVRPAIATCDFQRPLRDPQEEGSPTGSLTTTSKGSDPDPTY